MESEVRKIEASEKTALLIDKGAESNTQMKKFTAEDKSIKTTINAEAAPLFQDGETVIQLQGLKSAANVTRKETYTIDAEAQSFPEVKQMIKEGKFGDTVKIARQIRVTPDKVEEAVNLLNRSGIIAVIDTTYSVTAPEVRKMVASSLPNSPSVEALNKVMKMDVSYAVSYEKK